MGLRLHWQIHPVLLGTLVLCFSFQLRAESKAAVLEHGSGCVRKAGGSCNAVKPGHKLQRFDTFETSSQGAMLRFADHIRVDVSPGSKLEMQAKTKVSLGRGKDAEAVVAKLLKGGAKINIVPTKKPSRLKAILLQCPHRMNAIASEGKTQVSLGNGWLAVGAEQGNALISANNRWAQVKAGHSQVVFSNGKHQPARRLITAPKILSLPALVLAFHNSSHKNMLEWKAVPFAKSYHVRVLPEGLGPPLLDKVLPAKKTKIGFQPQQAGKLRVLVQATDEQGIESLESSGKNIHVVLVTLPKGAVVTNQGQIQLPIGQRIHVDGAKGVEAAIWGTQSYAPLPTNLGLLLKRPQRMAVRVKGTTETTMLDLAPREIQARVTLGPATAQWPRDTLRVSVRLLHSNSLPADTDIQMKPVVTLDLKRIPVRWRKVNGVMEATIKPRPLTKPTTLRVEVSDQYGFELGRGMLEIVPSR
jgi:hypothetical protein